MIEPLGPQGFHAVVMGIYFTQESRPFLQHVYQGIIVFVFPVAIRKETLRHSRDDLIHIDRAEAARCGRMPKWEWYLHPITRVSIFLCFVECQGLWTRKRTGSTRH